MSKSVVTSRRSFIKGAVAGAVSAGVAPVMAAPAPQNGLPAKWDGEADVVIVGFGGAGATTGIVAAQNGANPNSRGIAPGFFHFEKNLS